MRFSKPRSVFVVSFIVFSTLLGPSAQAAGLACPELPAIFAAFAEQHYSHPRLDEPTKEKAAVQFVEWIDPSKTSLLESEASKLKADLPQLFATVRQGNCGPLADALDLVIRRAETDRVFAAKMLGDGYALDENATVVLDPKKRGYSKTEAERLERLKSFIHFQISNYLLTGMALPQAKKQLTHRYELIVKRLKERQQKGEVITAFADAFAQALDPHSSYMSADVLTNFQIQMRLSLEGIGASLSSQDGFVTVESLVPGGSAEKTGKLRPKDKIIGVAQKGESSVATIDMDLDDVVKMIRGPKGSPVTLTVLREGDQARTFQLTIVRDKIDVKSQAAKLNYETRKVGDKSVTIGVIELPSFYGGEGGRSSYQDVKTLLQQARDKKVDGIVLDLSKNGGGLLEDAVRISGLFIKRGAVVGTQDSKKKMQVLEDEDSDVVWNGPLVVLTSTVSASASEILAGALQDYRRAVVVGSKTTFGKGTVQTLMPISQELGAIKVTVAMFFLPSGSSTQQRGVPADVFVPNIFDGADLAEAKLDNALPPQQVAPFLSREANGQGVGQWKMISTEQIATLNERSKARREKDPGFTKVLAKIEEQRGGGTVKLSELRKKSAGKDKKKADGDDEELKALEAVVEKEAVNVAADLIGLGHSGGANLGNYNH